MILTLRRLALHVLALFVLSPGLSWAFDLDALRAQLTATPVVRGKFAQEKHLRALPQPLVSRGEFVLANGQGLLWRLRSPLQQTIRITPHGIARLLPDGRWQPAPDNRNRESRLFLDLLGGDMESLEKKFELRLEGSPADWRMVMTPNSMILRQIFTTIEIRGAALVQVIELHEAQGDRTVIRMEDAKPASSLNDGERHDFAD